MPYIVLGIRWGATSLTISCRRSAIARSSGGISATFASRSFSPAARLSLALARRASAFSSAARSLRAAFSPSESAAFSAALVYFSVFALVLAIVRSSVPRGGAAGPASRSRQRGRRSQGSAGGLPHQRGDALLHLGSELGDGEVDGPHAAVVEPGGVVEPEHRVPGAELGRRLEEAEAPAVLRPRGHAVPGGGLELRRRPHDHLVDPLGQDAVGLRQLGDLRHHLLQAAAGALPPARRLQLGGALPHGRLLRCGEAGLACLPTGRALVGSPLRCGGSSVHLGHDVLLSTASAPARRRGGSTALLDAHHVAGGVAERAVAHAVRLVGGLLHDLGAAGLEPR